MRIKQCLILLFLTLLSFKNFATHIVGGEIYYDCLGNNNYKITLKVYRDCINGIAPYDDPATVFIFNSSGAFIDSVEIPFPGSVQLPVTINNPCFTPPTNICVEEAIYQTIVNLPPLAGGYDIVYQRCCRNQTILNLINPGDVGSTYMTHIPDPALAICNNSSRYNNFPPIFLCAEVPLIFDHSSTDPDGDSIYYEFCDPFTGLYNCCPILGVAGASINYTTQNPGPSGCGLGAYCPGIASPPPYTFVPWLAPYNASYPMSSSPAMAVNPSTGLMTGTPNMIGQWVVGVCAREYRNGVLINTNKRDFQFNVVNCPGLPVASIPQQQTFCFGYTVNFSQTSLNAFSYHWDFGDPTTALDTSNVLSPTYTYPFPGNYDVMLIINPGTLCADTAINTFNIQPLLDPNFVSPPGECIYENSFNLTAAGAFMGNGTFTWNFGPNATPSTSNAQNPTNVVFDSIGIYSVTLTVSENGCTETYTSNLEVYPKPVANYGLAVALACDLQPVQFVDSSSSTTPLNYTWTFGDGTFSSEQNPAHLYPAIGNYSTNLIIANSYGCKDTFALPSPLGVYPSPVAGFSVTPQDTSIFHPQVTTFDQSIGAIDCNISFGDGWSSNSCDTIHSYTAPGTYTLMQVVTNVNGCRDTAYLDVIIRPEFLFWIPNAFTPNNNGLNDVFKPVILGVHNYEFLIFDRWGEQIFKTNDMNEGWNGFFKGRLCTNDVFVYKIVFRDDVDNLDHQYIGRVTLVR
jgi:gliding motility-associated-like protein